MVKLVDPFLTTFGTIFCLVACSHGLGPTPAATLESTKSLAATSSPTITPSSTSSRPAPLSTLTALPSPTSTATLDLAPRRIETLGRGMITGVFRTPDGKRILYAADGELHIVDAATHIEQGTVEVDDTDLLDVFFSADGRLAAAAPSHGQIPVIDLEHRQVVAKMDGGEIGVSVKFTPDDRYAVSAITWIVSHGSETNIEVWDLNQTQLLKTITAPEEHGAVFLSNLAISPDGQWVAAGGSDNNVYVWSVPQGELKVTLRGHVGIVRAVAASTDGRMLASGGDDGTLRLWNPTTGQLIRRVTGLNNSVSALHLSAGGAGLWIDEFDAPVQMLSLATFQLSDVHPAEPTPDPFRSLLEQRGYSVGAIYDHENPVVFSPDGNSLASGSDVVLKWNLGAPGTPVALNGLPGYARKLAYSADGRRLAAITEGGNLRVWDVLASRVVFSATQQSEISAALSPDGERIILDQGDSLGVWDLEASLKTARLKTGAAHQGKLVAFSADGSQVYTIAAGDRVVHIWNSATGSLAAQISLPGRSGETFSADALHWPLLAGLNNDGEQTWVEIWNLEMIQTLRLPLSARAHGAQTLHFSPDGRLLIGLVYDPEQLLAWRTDTGQRLYLGTLDIGSSYFDIRPDSNLLALGHDGTVELWDISALHSAALLPAAPEAASPTPYATVPQDTSSRQTPLPPIPLTPVAFPTLASDAISPDNAGRLAEIAHFGEGTLMQAQWSRDEQTITAVGALGTFQYSSATLSETASYSSHIPLTGVAQRADGNWVAVGSLGEHTQVLDIQTGRVITDFIAGEPPILSPNGLYVAYGGRNSLLTWDLTAGRPPMTLHSFDNGNVPAAFSPNGRMLAKVQFSNSIRVWDTNTGLIVDALGGPAQPISALAFDANGRRLAATAGGTAWIWTIQSGAPPQTYTVYFDPDTNVSAPRQVTAVAISPDDAILAAGTSEREVWLFDRQTGSVFSRLTGLAASIQQVQFSPDGTRLLALDADGALAVWDVAHGQLLQKTTDHTGQIGGFVFRDDGQLSAWENNTAWVLRPSDVAPLQTISVLSGTIFAAGPDGGKLAVYSPYHISLWDGRSGVLQRTLPDDASETEVGYYPRRTLYGAEFTADSKRLLYFGTGGTWLYDSSNGHFLQYFLENASNLAAFSPDGAHLVLCYGPDDCRLDIWDMKTGYHAQTLESHFGYYESAVQAAYLPDGLHIAAIVSAQQDKFELWDASTGRKLAQLDWPQSSLTTLALSPDGRLAALGQGDGHIALLDLSSLKVLAQLDGHRGAVNHLAFARDGRYLASAGVEGVIRIWGLP
jgi:WD40 repeat protein